jgi:hypothetical protein
MPFYRNWVRLAHLPGAIMSLSAKVLAVISTAAGLFEAVSVPSNAHEGGPVAALLTAVFAAVFLGCAWALWSRQSIVATIAIGLFLFVDVAGVPFYTKQGWQDWVIQLGFAAVGLVGLVACVNVLRHRRHARGLTASPQGS